MSMYLRYVVGDVNEVLVQGGGGVIPPHAALVLIGDHRYRVVDLEYVVNWHKAAVGNEPQILTVVNVWLEVEEDGQTTGVSQEHSDDSPE